MFDMADTFAYTFALLTIGKTARVNNAIASTVVSSIIISTIITSKQDYVVFKPNLFDYY